MDPTETNAGGGTRRSRSTALVPALVVALLAVAALVVSNLALARPSRAQAAVHPERATLTAAARSAALTAGATISVTGSGTVQGTPDEVSFTIGVHSTAATAAGALAANDGQLRTLESNLEHHGVPPSGLQTSSLALYDDTNPTGGITGFSVDDDLNVDMTDVSTAGTAIDAAAEAVGNGVNLDGISFSISNKSALLAHARAAAMANARTEAAQVAAGAGLALGPVEKVSDDENAASSFPSYDASQGLAVLGAGALTLEAGRQPVSVQVSVVYQLKG